MTNFYYCAVHDEVFTDGEKGCCETLVYIGWMDEPTKENDG